MIYLPKHPRESKRGNIGKTIYQYPIQINEANKGHRIITMSFIFLSILLDIKIQWLILLAFFVLKNVFF